MVKNVVITLVFLLSIFSFFGLGLFILIGALKRLNVFMEPPDVYYYKLLQNPLGKKFYNYYWIVVGIIFMAASVYLFLCIYIFHCFG